VSAGICTATESACVACIYALVLGVFVFKTITLKDVKPLLLDTLKVSGASLFALATANALGQLLSYYNVNQMVGSFFTSNLNNKFAFLIALFSSIYSLGRLWTRFPL
jgi:TRAP-type C4-dicarboxylate transport system permease large subunit